MRDSTTWCLPSLSQSTTQGALMHSDPSLKSPPFQGQWWMYKDKHTALEMGFKAPNACFLNCLISSVKVSLSCTSMATGIVEAMMNCRRKIVRINNFICDTFKLFDYCFIVTFAYSRLSLKFRAASRIPGMSCKLWQARPDSTQTVLICSKKSWSSPLLSTM